MLYYNNTRHNNSDNINQIIFILLFDNEFDIPSCVKNKRVYVRYLFSFKLCDTMS